MAMAWTDSAKYPCYAALLTRLDAGAGRANLRIYTATSDELARVYLTDPAAPYNHVPLVLTFDSAVSADLTGTADHASLVAADGVFMASDIPCQQGTEPVSGKVVLTTLLIVAGTAVQGVSFTIT